MSEAKLQKQTPLNELKRTFKGTLIPSLVMIVVALVLGVFLSGLIYQYLGYTFGKMRHFSLGDSFSYGMGKIPLVSFIIAVGIYYSYYRMLRIIPRFQKNYDNGIIRSENETFGGAHFQTEEEIKKNFIVSKKISDTDEEIFGIDYDGNVCSLKYPGGMNHNRVFFGAPGSGKTSAIIKTDIYQCAKRGESILVTDSKGSVYEETVSVMKKMGYTIKVLNLKPNEFKNSNAFNVMESLDPNNVNFASDCAVISNIIIKNTQGDDPMDYWAKTETVALQMTIMLLASRPEYIESHQNNIYGVYEFLTTKSNAEIKRIFTSLPLTNPTRIAYEGFAKASEQNQGQTLNGLTSRLRILNNPMLKEILSRNEIDLLAPMQKPCIYYVIIPDNDDTYKFIASLFFTTIFKVQCDYSDSLTKEEKKNQLTVFYELDEYKNIGGVVGMDTKMSTVRSRKICITIILQFLKQLDIVHDEDKAKEILNDCTVKGLLSTNDMDTAKYFSDLCGTFTVKSLGERYEEQRTDIVKLHNDVKMSISENRRLLVLPEELMNDKMDRDEIIYVISSMAPVRMKKCFAEKNGELIHPMEKLGAELGYKKAGNFRPHWRKIKEDAEAQKMAAGQNKITKSPSVNVKAEEVEIKEEDPKPSSSPVRTEVKIKPVVTPEPDTVSEDANKPKQKSNDSMSPAEKLNKLLNGEL